MTLTGILIGVLVALMVQVYIAFFSLTQHRKHLAAHGQHLEAHRRRLDAHEEIITQLMREGQL